jgi:hypothetical protein
MTTYDSKGIQYIFGFKNNSNRWQFPKRKFHITDPKNVYGQYLSSMWYSRLNNCKNIEFIIVGVKGNINYNIITSLVNGAEQTYKSNKLTRFEKINNIVFKDYYILDREKYYEYNKDCNTNSTNLIDIDIMGKYNKSTLEISTRYIDNSIYTTCPQFYIMHKSSN